MNRVVKNHKLAHLRAKPCLRRALCVLATGAGVASYVTLVLLLTQKNLPSPQAVETIDTTREGASKAREGAQQATFVSKIIRLHKPADENTQALAELIVSESARAKIDPLFILAVIRQESMFRHRAVSPKGAKGLMQLMPATGRYISERERIVLKGAEDLHDPATNIRLGIAYLQYLDKKFHGNRERVLLAYNWGPSNVMHSLNGSTTPPTHSVRYAQTILSAHRAWTHEFTRYAFNATILPDATLVG